MSTARKIELSMADDATLDVHMVTHGAEELFATGSRKRVDRVIKGWVSFVPKDSPIGALVDSYGPSSETDTILYHVHSHYIASDVVRAATATEGWTITYIPASVVESKSIRRGGK